MSKNNSKFKVASVQYVHDPEAMQDWFEVYIELFKEELISNASKQKKGEHMD
ncbi:hypothetical protein [Pontibacillus salipaludis]|uniref:hypothetical protein n=1 Tax=Pontibacillus salipaludis TaxID=1697394 RepID=UPI0031EBF02C